MGFVGSIIAASHAAAPLQMGTCSTKRTYMIAAFSSTLERSLMIQTHCIWVNRVSGPKSQFRVPEVGSDMVTFSIYLPSHMSKIVVVQNAR